MAASRFFGLAAMIVSAVFGGCRQVQDSLLYYPAARVGELPPTPDGYVVEPLAIVDRDSVELRGWLVRPTLAPAPLLIYYGGNAEEVSWLIAMAPRYGNRAIALMNYRGYGESGGRPSETALLADALAVFDKLNGRADIDAARVAVMGRSLGSGVAVHVAANRSVDQVILVSPYDSVEAVAAGRFPRALVRFVLSDRYDSTALAPRIDAPLLWSQEDATASSRSRTRAVFTSCGAAQSSGWNCPTPDTTISRSFRSIGRQLPRSCSTKACFLYTLSANNIGASDANPGGPR